MKPPLTPDEIRLIQGLHGTPGWRALKKYLFWQASVETTGLNRGDFSDKPWTAGKMVGSRDMCERIASLPETLKLEPEKGDNA